jgi:cation:H+ antiporter
MDWLSVIAGLAILVVAGDALVKGAVALALRLGIPALIVGLTVVAFGTSAPELLVSVVAALRGEAGIALGNVVGSNIVNVLLILGLPALFTTIHASGSDTVRSFGVMIAVSVLFIALCFVGPLTWWHGLVLLTGLALVLFDNIRTARAHRAAVLPEDLVSGDGGPGWKIALFVIGGLAGLALGAELLVSGAVSLARSFGISETVIGLTLVALGTSLPELMTSIMAAVRRHADVALGNVIGSNIFNLLSIIGVAALISPIPVAQQFLTFDLWVMLGTSLLLVPFVLLRRDVTRGAGIVLVAIYVAYAATLVS